MCDTAKIIEAILAQNLRVLNEGIRQRARTTGDPVSGGRVIERIEHLQTELEFESLGDGGVLEHTEVELVQSRSAFDVTRDVAKWITEPRGCTRPVENKPHRARRNRNQVALVQLIQRIVTR